MGVENDSWIGHTILHFDITPMAISGFHIGWGLRLDVHNLTFISDNTNKDVVFIDPWYKVY